MMVCLCSVICFINRSSGGCDRKQTAQETAEEISNSAVGQRGKYSGYY